MVSCTCPRFKLNFNDKTCKESWGDKNRYIHVDLLTSMHSKAFGYYY